MIALPISKTLELLEPSSPAILEDHEELRRLLHSDSRSFTRSFGPVFNSIRLLRSNFCNCDLVFVVVV